MRAATVEREGQGMLSEEGLGYPYILERRWILTDSGCQRYCACSYHLDEDGAVADNLEVMICHWHRLPSSQPSRHRNPCWGG